MRKEDLLSIGITFVMGFAVGVYVYISGFAGFWNDVTVPEQLEEDGLVIVGDEYGGCLDACRSFRVSENGAYRYLHFDETEARMVSEGRLPYGMRQELEAVLQARDLVTQSQGVRSNDCVSYNNEGVDYRYIITFDGSEYTLDSCETAVQTNSPMWRAVSGVWDYLELN